MFIDGTITRQIEGRDVEIPFHINTDTGTYTHWGHDTLTSARTSSCSKRCATPRSTQLNHLSGQAPTASHRRLAGHTPTPEGEHP